jgi:hypothetical protein
MTPWLERRTESATCIEVAHEHGKKISKAEYAAYIVAVLVGLAHAYVCACRCRLVMSQCQQLYGDRRKDIRGPGASIEARSFKYQSSELRQRGGRVGKQLSRLIFGAGMEQ